MNGSTLAIAWAQYRLLGGWRVLVSTTLAYAATFAFTMAAFLRGLNAPHGAIYSGFVSLFLVLQVLTLLAFGTLRVGLAIRSDMNSRVIESHRLMPLPPAQAILGYLLGAPLQAYTLAVSNFALGAVAAVGAGLPLNAWAVVNGVLLSFAVFYWLILAFFSFRSGVPLVLSIMGLMGAPMAAVMTSEGIPVVASGFSVLLSPLIGTTIFDIRTGLQLDAAHVVSLVAQAAIGGLYFVAACRRYRSDDEVAFTPALSLPLLGLWVGACVVGTRTAEAFRPFRRFGIYSDGPPEVELVLTFISVLLLAILPVSAGTAVWERRRRAGGPRKVMLPPFAVAVLTGAICAAASVAAGPLRANPAAVAETAVVCLAFAVGVRYILGIVHRLGRQRTRLVMVGWLVLTWCAPAIFEMVHQARADDEFVRDYHLSPIGLCSPIVQLINSWTRDVRVRTPNDFGLIAQCVLAAALGVAYHALRTHRRPTPLPPLPPLPPAVEDAAEAVGGIV